MARKPLGLDWLDLTIQTGITVALATIAASASVEHSEVGVSLVVAASLGILAWRRSRAAERFAPMTTGENAAERMALLESRLTELEAQQARVLELEERLDFAERLLTQVRDRDSPRLAGPARQD